MSDLDLTLRLCVVGTYDEEGRKQEAFGKQVHSGVNRLSRHSFEGSAKST